MDGSSNNNNNSKSKSKPKGGKNSATGLISPNLGKPRTIPGGSQVT